MKGFILHPSAFILFFHPSAFILGRRAAADQRYDLDSVVRLQTAVAVLLDRHYFAVDLDGNPAPVVAQLGQQFGQGRLVGTGPKFAINGDWYQAW